MTSPQVLVATRVAAANWSRASIRVAVQASLVATANANALVTLFTIVA